MKPKTEEFLNLLLWSADRLAHSTFRNLTGSYEGWAYRNGLLRQAATLERQGLLERHTATLDRRLYRLTEHGRLHALGGRDPAARWAREWDGLWRIALFDIPAGQNAWRERLRRHLQARGCGCLQNSVWVTPDSFDDIRALQGGGNVQAGSLLFLEARPCGGESDADIVAGAWDFEAINRRYARHARVLDQRPVTPASGETGAVALRRWGMAEREAWVVAVRADPLLPERLLPPGYAGRAAWRRRIEVLRLAGEQLRDFHG